MPLPVQPSPTRTMLSAPTMEAKILLTLFMKRTQESRWHFLVQSVNVLTHLCVSPLEHRAVNLQGGISVKLLRALILLRAIILGCVNLLRALIHRHHLQGGVNVNILVLAP